MKGHGPFQVTLQGGGIFDAPRTDDTFEIQGAIITVKVFAGPRSANEVHVIKLWEKLVVPEDQVS